MICVFGGLVRINPENTFFYNCFPKQPDNYRTFLKNKIIELQTCFAESLFYKHHEVVVKIKFL